MKLILYRVGLIYHVQIDTEFQLLTQASSKPNLDRKGIHDQQEHLLQWIQIHVLHKRRVKIELFGTKQLLVRFI